VQFATPKIDKLNSLTGRTRILCTCVSLVVLSFTGTNLKADDTRVKATGHNAFSRPVANMPIRQRLDFSVGNSFFRNPWVASPSSTKARDGLGPLFNTNACQNCHIKDGRGHAPNALDDNAVSLLVRLSIDGEQALKPHQANHTDPRYGGQLQDFAVPELIPEGRVVIHYQQIPVTLAGGEVVTLRKPKVTIEQLAYGSLHPKIQLSARIAPPMIGLGLLEAIDQQDIERQADPDDHNADGISGAVNQVWDRQSRSLRPGRFGWKAGQPTLHQQNAAAFNGDLGVTSVLFEKENCRPQQADCVQHAKQTSDGTPEIAPHLLDKVTFYTQNLAVPLRRNPHDKQVRQGEQLFAQLQCRNCHTPAYTTRSDYPLAWLTNQTIAPYTDMLLHDMGEGLTDGTREFRATAREWRTPPLWGIGLTKAVGGVESYLHDGRAQSLQQAILWHGGEAQASRDQYIQLAPEERLALIKFLEDL